MQQEDIGNPAFWFHMTGPMSLFHGNSGAVYFNILGMVTTAEGGKRKPFSPDGVPVLRHIVNACLQGKCEDDTSAGHVQC